MCVLQSLVVNDGDYTKSQKLGGASSITSITSYSKHENGHVQVGRAASWAVSFEKLLQDAAGLATFTVSNTVLSYSQENDFTKFTVSRVYHIHNE